MNPLPENTSTENIFTEKACVTLNAAGTSPYLFVSEHAGNFVPASHNNLGLSEADITDHIGWDLHIRAVGERVANALDATYIYQPYSRLLIDCNRPLDAPDSVPPVVDRRPVPGNQNLTAAELRRRHRDIFHPFHDTIANVIDGRLARGQPTVFVTLHSFTPAMQSGGDDRPWPITIQYGRDPAFSRTLMNLLRASGDFPVGDNVPYPVRDETHYTIPTHGEKRKLLHSMIEIRQDVIADVGGQQLWSDTLVDVLSSAL